MKRVYQITPVSLYDVRGVESWLEDMALRGLALKRIRPLFSTFEEGPARKTRYRAEPCRLSWGAEPPQAMLDLYRDFGWDCVCQTNSELLIFSTQDPNAPEPHSDPALQSHLWKKLYKAQRRSFLSQLAALFGLLWLLSMVLLAEHMPVHTFLTTIALLIVLEMVLMIFLLAASWADVERLALLVRQLEQNIPLEHHAVYLPRRWGPALFYLLFFLLLMGIFFSNIILPFSRDWLQPLDALTAFPRLTLESLEGKNYHPRTLQERGRDYANFCDRERYPLCPEYWRVVQSGRIEPENWTRLELEWYRLPGWLSFLAAPLAKEQLEVHMGLDQDIWWSSGENAVWTVDYIPWDGVDFLAVARSEVGGFQLAAASAGKRAVTVRYTGGGNLAEHLEEIAAMVR